MRSWFFWIKPEEQTTRIAGLLVLVAILVATTTQAQVTTVDSFDTITPWQSLPADGIRLELSEDGGALRLDFDFQGRGGYAIARREVDLRLPENYAIRFWLRAEDADGDAAPVNDLEFKLIGPTGENVWWHNRKRLAYPQQWTLFTTKARHVSKAWGPLGDVPPDRITALELAITAQEGGAGTVWIDSLTIEPLPPARPYTGTPEVTATVNQADAANVLDGDPATVWSSEEDEAVLTLDFGEERAFGGLVLDWGERYARDYDVAVSSSGTHWSTRYQARGSDGRRDYVPLTETDARYLRIEITDPGDFLEVYGPSDLAELSVEPLEFAATPDALFERIARDASRGYYPRYLLGEAVYWTVLGADAVEEEALIDEYGTVEVGEGAFSIEPVLIKNFGTDAAELLTWANADTVEQELNLRRSKLWNADLNEGVTARFTEPALAVTRHYGGTTLRITPRVSGHDEPVLDIEYRVETPRRLSGYRLALLLRPFLVNPSYQFLSAPSGVGTIEEVMRGYASWLLVDDWPVFLQRPPDGGATSSFEGGGVIQRLASRHEGRRYIETFDERARHRVNRFDEMALVYEVPDGRTSIRLRVPMRADASARALLRERAEESDPALGTLRLRGPFEVEDLEEAILAQAHYVLINRDGPAVQPGSRAYDRSWIRDGALTSATLLQLGMTDVAEDFARWYAPFQYDDGKVPCCVDERGADPVPEHDSPGQLIYLIAKTHRYTHDDAFLRELYPHIRKAAFFLDSLRAQTRTAAFQTDSTRHLFGLLPPSISHEGYADKPAYSYWDDLFALRGYRDALYAAEILGETEDAAHFRTSLDEFSRDFAASAEASMRVHGLDTLPGAADRGDFDATSTSIAFDPVEAVGVLPQDALERTFERYWEFFEHRMTTDDWEAYTPYEWRNVGALLRLGQPERAHTAMRWFMQHRRPKGWQQWAEVVYRDERAPKFIGDMPHTWVGSDFVRAVLNLFAYHDDRVGAPGRLVVGAGIPHRWTTENGGLRLRGLQTYGGPLGYEVTSDDARTTYVFNKMPTLPEGGLILHGPFDRAPIRAEVDGAAVALDGNRVMLDSPAERVVFFYR